MPERDTAGRMLHMRLDGEDVLLYLYFDGHVGFPMSMMHMRVADVCRKVTFTRTRDGWELIRGDAPPSS